MARTALVVPVDGGPALESLRARLASDARLGVPPHVTVLMPFVPWSGLDGDVLGRLARAVGAVESFDFALTRTSWFGEDVLWLAPDTPSRFVELTEAVCVAFPGLRPYGGAHDDVVPHATVGDSSTRADLLAAEREISRELPLRNRASHVVLLAEAPDQRWRPVRAIRFALRNEARC